VFNALDGDGAFSPERAGGLPTGALIKLCFSGKYTEQEVYKKAVGNGGFNAYLGTNDMRDVAKMIQDGDTHADEVREAFILQVSKNIGSMAAVLNGKVDRIIITGGIAYNKEVVEKIEERTGFIAPFTVYPGEDELLALAQGALRVMNGEEKAMEY
jgi:butyrate kinase